MIRSPAFGRELWRWLKVHPDTAPNLVLVMGRETETE